MRAKAEDYLENVREKRYSMKLSRLNSIFVFPKDDKLEERAFHWARTFASTPDSSSKVYLLELETDDVEWHNSQYYEDLYFLLDNKRYGMCDICSTKESLCKGYWENECNKEGLDVEGLTKNGKIVDITPYLVTHNNIRKLE